MSLFAQSGTIRGTVIEDESGEPVMFGDVTIEETGDYVSTDLEGAYSFDVAPGTYTLVFEYVGLADTKISDVIVTDGQVTTIDARMGSGTELLQEVVITATQSRNNEAALATIKRKSTSMIDGISSKKFKQTGDSNASDAVKRVTGVSVEGGKYVYVRGLGDRYTKTMLNGIDIPGLDPDRNSLQIDIFPTTLLDNMIVYKSAIAELPADFTGGVVNIETKSFPDERKLDISLGMSYNPSMHFNNDYLYYKGGKTDWLGFDDGTRELPKGAVGPKIPTPISGASSNEINYFVNSYKNQLNAVKGSALPDYSFGISYGDQINIGDNKLGVILSGTYKSERDLYKNNIYGNYQISTKSNEYQLVESRYQTGNVGNENILLGGLAGLAFKTSKTKHKLSILRLQNGESTAGSFDIISDRNEKAVGQSNFAAISNNLQYSQRSLTNGLLNGVYNLGSDGGLKIDWRVSPTWSKMTEPDIRKSVFNSDRPNKLIIAAGAGGNPSRIWRYLDEVSLVGKVDLTKEYTVGENDFKLKFGGSYVNKDRNYKILTYDLQFFGSQPEWKSTADNVDFNEILDPKNIYGNGGTIYYQSGNSDPNPNAYNSNSKNLAFYVSNEFNLDKLKVTAGIRTENFEQRHTGRDIQYATQGGDNGNNLNNAKVIEGKWKLFPSVNATYELFDKQNLRASYSRTTARPSFKELSFAQIIDPLSDRIFNGGLFPFQGEWNGNLVSTDIDNFDLRWELFQDKGQLFSVSTFYKGFKNPIEIVRIAAQQTSNEFQPRNVGDGKVFGAEFEIKKALNFLTEDLGNLTFSTNVTLAKSTIDMTSSEYQSRLSYAKDGETISKTRKMAGQAPFIINAGLNYDNVESGLNAGLFYNVKGRTLTVVGGGLFPDVYSKPFHSLNFSSGYSFGKDRRTKVSFKISNILGQVRQEVFTGYKANDQYYSRVDSGRAFSLGLSYRVF